MKMNMGKRAKRVVDEDASEASQGERSEPNQLGGLGALGAGAEPQKIFEFSHYFGFTEAFLGP